MYLAFQHSLSRLVAVKLLGGGNASDVGRFRREAEVLAQLDHPGIVPVHAFEEVDGELLIAMKWLQGQPLQELAGAVSPREAARLMVPIARAVHAAHDLGIIHRDLKPQNIVLHDDVPVVLDFGLSWTASTDTMTGENVVPGTLAYIAPERLRAPDQQATVRGDVYGLGAILYELLAGDPPYSGPSVSETVAAIVRGTLPPLALARGERDLEVIIGRAMDLDPSRRFQSARDFADDLERFLAREPITSRPAGPLERGAMWVARNPRASAIGAAVFAPRPGRHGVLELSISRERWDRETLTKSLREAIDSGDLGAARILADSALARWPESKTLGSENERLRTREQWRDLEDVVLAKPDEVDARRPGGGARTVRRSRPESPVRRPFSSRNAPGSGRTPAAPLTAGRESTGEAAPPPSPESVLSLPRRIRYALALVRFLEGNVPEARRLASELNATPSRASASLLLAFGDAPPAIPPSEDPRELMIAAFARLLAGDASSALRDLDVAATVQAAPRSESARFG